MQIVHIYNMKTFTFIYNVKLRQNLPCLLATGAMEVRNLHIFTAFRIPSGAYQESHSFFFKMLS